jgi:very-short-patch-repair endonuclease
MTKIHNIEQLKIIRRKLRKDLTPAEKIFWYKIRDTLVQYRFRRQHSIGQYVVDFYCAKLKLIIEIDGDSHTDEKQIIIDQQRNAYFEKLNLSTIRYNNRDIVNNMSGVFDDLMKKISNLT